MRNFYALASAGRTIGITGILAGLVPEVPPAPGAQTVSSAEAKDRRRFGPHQRQATL
jgi:hypothetical protein